MEQKIIRINLGWAEDDGTMPPWVVNVVAARIDDWLTTKGLKGGYDTAGPGKKASIRVERPEDWDVPEVKKFTQELGVEVQRIIDEGEPKFE